MYETMTYVLPNLGYDIRIEISGVDSLDCLQELERRKKDLVKTESGICFYTPKLIDLIEEKGLIKTLN